VGNIGPSFTDGLTGAARTSPAALTEPTRGTSVSPRATAAPTSPSTVLTEEAQRAARATAAVPTPLILGFQDTATLPAWVLSLGQLAVRPTVKARGTTYTLMVATGWCGWMRGIRPINP
jgi:hypothetical protein